MGSQPGVQPTLDFSDIDMALWPDGHDSNLLSLGLRADNFAIDPAVFLTPHCAPDSGQQQQRLSQQASIPPELRHWIVTLLQYLIDASQPEGRGQQEPQLRSPCGTRRIAFDADWAKLNLVPGEAHSSTFAGLALAPSPIFRDVLSSPFPYNGLDTIRSDDSLSESSIADAGGPRVRSCGDEPSEHQHVVAPAVLLEQAASAACVLSPRQLSQQTEETADVRATAQAHCLASRTTIRGRPHYSCKICGQGTYADKRGCQRHIIQKHTDIHYCCPYCGKMFSRIDNCRRHKLKCSGRAHAGPKYAM